ncbi:hypothetical protein FG93_05275 [Bosea sp. LC85]|nr:hypothetical protein FG93_05275 [Bosea sp. LC85]
MRLSRIRVEREVLLVDDGGFLTGDLAAPAAALRALSLADEVVTAGASRAARCRLHLAKAGS